MNNTDKTPIEIALGIDENGMTTASNLYQFLELDKSHYARWCNKNIKNNKFAIQGEDYILFANKGDENRKYVKPRTDYHLTMDFAKKLSMTGNSERHEQAKEYFIACETGLKIATKKLQQPLPESHQLADSIIRLGDVIQRMYQDLDQRLQRIERQSIYDGHQIEPKKYTRWKTKTFNKMKLIMDDINENTNVHVEWKDIISMMINETEDIYNIDISSYVDAYKEMFNLESEPQVLDVIQYWKDVRDMLSLTLDSNLEKLGLQAHETVKETIIDQLARERKNQKTTTNN